MLFFSKLAFVLRTLDNEKEAVMLLIVFSKLYTLSHTMITKYNDFTILFYIYQA